MLYLPPLIGGFYISNQYRKARDLGEGAGKSQGAAIVSAILAGLVAAATIVLLTFILENVKEIGNFKLRDMFVNASPKTVKILTSDRDIVGGATIIFGAYLVLAFFGAILELLPGLLRKGITSAITWTLGIGLLSELVIQILRATTDDGVVRTYFQGKSLRTNTALIILVVALVASIIWSLSRNRVSSVYTGMNAGGRRFLSALGGALVIALLLILPGLLGTFLSEVLSLVGLFVLMGLGLNIAVGLAGLLDLGYVTNFAIGAYIMAVLTSGGPLGIGPDWLNFWMVLPICIVASMCTGFFFALPVLRMKGDYLAIATLGFGEIIRLLALSDWLKPYIGGGQGIPLVPKANFFGWEINSPERIYYLVLAFCFLTLFVMLRLNNSRTGRQWMAIREDEDAASAMGIDTTITKVVAFTISAATGGLTGAIFAMKVTAIFPNSFDLLKSVNTLSLIIIGGLGSIPGIVVGAAALIGSTVHCSSS